MTKKLLMALAAVALVTTVGSLARATAATNAELGCRELNEVMAPHMEPGDDFLDCKEKSKDYVHMKSHDACVRYFIMEWGTLSGILNRHGYPPPKPYKHILRGCARLVLNMSQEEYDARCTNWCVVTKPN
jgi:hypothetical protein